MASGNPIVKDVHIAQQKFPGDRKLLLPDAIVTWTDEPPPREVHSPLLGTIRGLDDTGPRGHHRSEGFHGTSTVRYSPYDTSR